MGSSAAVSSVCSSPAPASSLPDTFDSQEGTIKDFLAMRFGGKSPLFAVEGDRIYGMIPAESLGVLDSNEKIKGLLKKGTLSNDNPILFSVDIKENFD